MSLFVRRIVLATATLVVAPATAGAQIGGLIKRKAAEAVKGPEKKADEKPADNAISLGGARELNAANIDALLEGMRVEISLREEFRAEVAKYPTREQYNKCQADVATSPEQQKLMSIIDLPDNASDEARQKALMKFAEEGTALLKKKCPLDPNDMSDFVKQKRLGEIEGKAAEAVARNRTGRGGSGNSSGGPFLSGDEPGVQQNDQERLKYAVDKERLTMLCAVLKADPKKRQEGLANGLRIPGTGTRIFWVFTPTEVKDAVQQKCDQFEKLMEKLK